VGFGFPITRDSGNHSDSGDSLDPQSSGLIRGKKLF
jgi:hypothetical protein